MISVRFDFAVKAPGDVDRFIRSKQVLVIGGVVRKKVGCVFVLTFSGNSLFSTQNDELRFDPYNRKFVSSGQLLFQLQVHAQVQSLKRATVHLKIYFSSSL